MRTAVGDRIHALDGIELSVASPVSAFTPTSAPPKWSIRRAERWRWIEPAARVLPADALPDSLICRSGRAAWEVASLTGPQQRQRFSLRQRLRKTRGGAGGAARTDDPVGQSGRNGSGKLLAPWVNPPRLPASSLCGRTVTKRGGRRGATCCSGSQRYPYCIRSSR